VPTIYSIWQVLLTPDKIFFYFSKLSAYISIEAFLKIPDTWGIFPQVRKNTSILFFVVDENLFRSCESRCYAYIGIISDRQNFLRRGFFIRSKNTSLEKSKN